MGGKTQMLNNYFKRSLKYIQESAKEAVAFEHYLKKYNQPKQLFKLNNRQHLAEDWIVGCDADIGGLSEAYWGLTEENKAMFWGKVSKQIPSNTSLKRSGYAGIRSKELPFTLFHKPRFDVEMYEYLEIRCKVHNCNSKHWYVNVQCDSIYPTHLFQHKLVFANVGKWETILVPFTDFTLTANGFVQERQLLLDTGKVKTIGFSTLKEGDFCLELDYINAYNIPRRY